MLASFSGRAGNHWPIHLVFTCLGHATVTHLMVWCPFMVVCALLCSAAIRNKTSPALPSIQWAVFITVSGLIVVLADMDLARLRGVAAISAAVCGVALVAIVAYFMTRRLQKSLGPRRYHRITMSVALVCGGVILVSGLLFVRSPLFNPTAYHVPATTSAHAVQMRPHVLWVVMDTVRPDRMSCYGYGAPTTPHLDELARTALVFEHAISNGTWTMPAHGSMFTGLSLRGHGADHGHRWLDDGLTTVAETLRAGGYSTAAFSNNPWVSGETNLTKGFELCASLTHLRRFARFSLPYLVEKWGITPFVPWLSPDYGGALTNGLVEQWLNAPAQADKPLFLFINYMEAHLPYRVPRAYRELFMSNEEADRSYNLRYKVHGDLVTALNMRFNFDGREFMAPSDRQIVEKQYLAAIRYVDHRVYELVNMFKQRGLWNNTLLVVTSDHGEYLDTHRMWGHVFLTYQDVAHVALLLREPGRESTRRVSTPVLLSDLYATVLRSALGGAPDSGNDDARDLFTLANEEAQPRLVVTEYNGPSDVAMKWIRRRGTPYVYHLAAPQIAAQDGRYKFIQSVDGREELYDLSTDPGEERDLIEAQPQTAAQLREYLVDWRERVPPFKDPEAKTTLSLSEETIRALRSLGYVGDED